MKSNSKQVRNLIKAHILESITDFECNEFTTVKDAANHLYSEFNRVANNPHNIKNIPNDQDRFSDYLNGLPFNFLYSYYDIDNFLNSLGINPGNKDFTNEQSLKRYHYLIYSEMLKNL
jgi:hypothetical protein